MNNEKQWDLAEILHELDRNYHHLETFGVRSLGLFGSYARGTANTNSDMDFLVDLELPSFNHYMDLKFWLEDTFSHAIDLVLIDTLKARLQSVILSEVVYAKRLSPLPRGHLGGDQAH
ncbi:MAG: nucleotidyltransferase [Candidatus Viridilinea halotolerans]|uniref:Nucleotidyltransferase n=1 Tax=Candidatus Viridilinea halotolerans TaxID=2491704 RepID=A0A426U4M0_9CHLR|nr:MAG: nucleotidyltransferase [Candidatus Viridilinea halotolerans]